MPTASRCRKTRISILIGRSTTRSHPLPKILKIPVTPPALERCQWCMETPGETDLVEHLQSLKDLPGGFGLAFAGAAEEIIRLREERDGLQRALRAVMRVVINVHDHQAQRTAAEQARQERVEAMLEEVISGAQGQRVRPGQRSRR